MQYWYSQVTSHATQKICIYQILICIQEEHYWKSFLTCNISYLFCYIFSLFDYENFSHSLFSFFLFFLLSYFFIILFYIIIQFFPFRAWYCFLQVTPTQKYAYVSKRKILKQYLSKYYQRIQYLENICEIYGPIHHSPNS